MEDIDKKEVLNLLKTSKGQMEGIIKMVENDRYCSDISMQILSVQALIRKSNFKIIDNHIRYCVKEAFAKGDKGGNEKVDEIIKLIDKYGK